MEETTSLNFETFQKVTSLVSSIAKSCEAETLFSPFKGWSRKSFELQQKCKPLLYTQGTFATFEVSPTKRSHHNLRFFTNNFARCKGMSLNCYQNVFCWTWEIDTSRILRHENSLLKVEIMEDRGNIKSLDWTNCSLSCNRTAAFLFDWTDGNAKVIPKPQEQFPPRGKSVNDAVFLQCTSYRSIFSNFSRNLDRWRFRQNLTDRFSRKK